MDKYLAQALREYNMQIPADSPWYTELYQLPASVQSRIEQRAEELRRQHV